MLSAQDAAVIKGMLARGDKQHDIAAEFSANGARIAEIKNGEKFADVSPAPQSKLPLPKPPRFIDPNAPLEQQVEILVQLIHNPPENSRIITFTSALADWVLTNLNGANRKPKPARIKRYAEAMASDEWYLTGETIVFSRGRRGLMLDGQNRLEACRKSNKKFRTHVVFGIDDDVFAVINTAKARTPSDLFQKQGKPYPAVLAAAVRWLMNYAAEKPMQRLSYSNQELWSFYQKLDEALITKAVEEAHATSKVFPRGALAAHLYLFEQKHALSKKRFTDDVSHNRRGAGKLAKVLALKRKDNMGRVNDVWVNALLVLTWNAYRRGEQVTARTLKWDSAEKEYPGIA